MENLKVLMMGGRRCGKTSVLASLFDQVTHGTGFRGIMSVSNQTSPQSKQNANGELESVETLSNKILELKRFLSEQQRGFEFIVDKSPTKNYWDYKMQIALHCPPVREDELGNRNISRRTKTMTMMFRDSNGEFFEGHNGQFTNEIQEYISGCDVFVVVVDTPYLMYDEEASVDECANLTSEIHNFLSLIDRSRTNSHQDAKQIIFVPVKCEKWIHDGTIDEVKQKILKLYKATIDFLNYRPNTEISIIPIQTAGDLVFSKMRQSYLVTYDGKTEKCAKISDNILQFSNGKKYKLMADDRLHEDPEGLFENLNIHRPSAWYRVKDIANPYYNPQNCEQIALHILRFMLTKARNNRSTNWFAQFFQSIFGQITYDDLSNAIIELTNRGLIKDSGEGIERIKIYS